MPNDTIRERRLYGFMVREAAESAVSAGEWIRKTTEEILAEARAEGQGTEQNLPFVSKVLRDD